MADELAGAAERDRWVIYCLPGNRFVVTDHAANLMGTNGIRGAGRLLSLWFTRRTFDSLVGAQEFITNRAKFAARKTLL